MILNAPLNVDEHLNKLLQMITKEGLVAVSKRKDLDQIDRSLLGIIASFEGVLEGSKEALEILKFHVPFGLPPKYKIQGTSLNAHQQQDPSSESKDETPGGRRGSQIEKRRVSGSNTENSRMQGTSLGMVEAFGTDHVLSQSEFPADEWTYTVIVENQTTDTWDDLWLWYWRTDAPGMVPLSVSVPPVIPGDIIRYRLHPCNKMRTYKIIIVTNMGQFPWPDGDGMTPERAKEFHSYGIGSAISPCGDHWTIVEE